VLAALQEARSAVQADQDKPALAILEMAEDDLPIGRRVDQTKDWARQRRISIELSDFTRS